MIIQFSTEQLKKSGKGLLILLAKIVEKYPAQSKIKINTPDFGERTTVGRQLDALEAWGILQQEGKGAARTIQLKLQGNAPFAEWISNNSSDAGILFPKFFPAQYDLLREEFPHMKQHDFDQAVKESLLSACGADPQPKPVAILQWVKRALIQAQKSPSIFSNIHKSVGKIGLEMKPPVKSKKSVR